MQSLGNVSTMIRRELITAGAGVGFAGIAGYVGWNWYNGPSIPDGLTIETLYLKRDVFTPDSSRDSESLAAREQYHTIVEDEETATRELQDLDAVTDFIEKTDFDDSYIVVVQNGMQSEPDLELDVIERIEDGLRLEFSIDAPLSGVDDDLVTHSFVIRVSDEREEAPETIDVTIEGYV